MTQNVVIAEFTRDENAQEAFRRIQNDSSTNGYEVYQADLVNRVGEDVETKEKLVTGTLTRSHMASDWAIGAILGILFGFNGFLIGGLFGLLAGTFYDSRQLERDKKLVEDALQTVQENTKTLILIVNEKYEDALDQKLHACNAVIHRAYTGDLKDQIRSRHNVSVTMN